MPAAGSSGHRKRKKAAVTATLELASANVLRVLAKGTQPEMLFPRVGKDAQEELQDILESYPEFVPGKRRRISKSAQMTYQFYMDAERHYSEQKALAKNVIRRELGDAQYGVTSRGIVIVERRMYPRAGYTVDPMDIDSVNPVRH